MTKIELKHLLGKQLEGTLSRNEGARLKQLIETAPNNDTLECLEELWDRYEDDGKHNAYAETLSAKLYRIFSPGHTSRNLFPRGIVRYAAAVILLFVAMGGVYYFTKQATVNQLAQTETRIETAVGERSRITLPDGTRVMISGNTRLSYPATFTGRLREVKLEGEAFFEVTKDERRPFVVRSSDVDVKVLGTSFNVFAYPHESYFETSLQSGMVEVSHRQRPQHTVVLRPNEKVRMDYRDGILVKQPSNLHIETAWTRNELYFQSDSLSRIFKKIEQFYGVSIRCEGPVPSDVFTAGYRESEITQVLNNLQQHYSFTYQKIGNKLTVRFDK